MLIQRAALCTTLLLWSAMASAQPLTPAAIVEIATEQLSKNENLAPGASIAVKIISGDTIVATQGVTDKKTKSPVNANTRFFSGSIGKTMTAIVVTTLIADGLITLDDPIDKYLSHKAWFSDLQNHDHITIRMLLNHSAGIPSYLDDTGFFLSQRSRRLKGYTPDQLVTYVAKDEPAGNPGAHFSYSDTHYILLGMIIEQVTSKSYYDLAQEIILDPLQLSNTTPLTGRDHQDLSNAYRKGGMLRKGLGISGQTLKKNRLTFTPDYEWTGGGFVTTPADLADFYHGLFTDPHFTRQRLLMTASHNQNRLSDTLSYGLGVYINTRDNAGPSYSHGGDFMGYRSAVLFNVATSMAIAVQANAKTYEPIDVGYTVLRSVKDNTQ